MYLNKILMILVFMVLGLIPFSPDARAEEATELSIVYINNLPDIDQQQNVGGLAELSGLLNQVRKSNKHVLFFHGGGYLAPSVLSSFDRGAHMIDLLNALHPDAVAAAKKEFTHREDELTLRAFEASFPIISANTYDPATQGNIEGIEQYQLFDVGPYKVGVFALTDPDVAVDYLLNRVSAKDTQSVVKAVSQKLRDLGANLVILMVDFPLGDINELLHSGAVDIVFDYEYKDVVHPLEKGVWIEMGAGEGRAAMMQVSMQGAGKTFSWKHEEEIVPLVDYPQDSAVQMILDNYRIHLSKLMDVVVGKTATALDTRRNSVRQQETAFGNLVTDAIRDFCASDVAFMNGGGIRGDRTYEPGAELTRRDIHNELPFRNHVYCIKVSGEKIQKSLENSVSRVEDDKGRFLQMSGMHLEFDPKAPAGKRVRSVLIGGKPLNLKKDYIVGTVDYLASGGDDFSMLRDCERIGNVGGSPLLWELLRSYIADRGTISPVVQGRIVRISK